MTGDVVARAKDVLAYGLPVSPDLAWALIHEVERLRRPIGGDQDYPLEIRHGWLVETGYEPDLIDGYGYLPDSDSHPLIRLDGLPGWVDGEALIAERDAALAEVERLREARNG